MGLLGYFPMVAVVLLVGLARYLDPSGVEQMARRTGLSTWQGWAVFVAATLPVQCPG